MPKTYTVPQFVIWKKHRAISKLTAGSKFSFSGKWRAKKQLPQSFNSSALQISSKPQRAFVCEEDDDDDDDEEEDVGLKP